MDKQQCRYCGQEVSQHGSCPSSPTKEHVYVSDGQHCVWCGQRFQNGASCTKSPTRKHALDK
jgi:hypothetical protein